MAAHAARVVARQFLKRMELAVEYGAPFDIISTQCYAPYKGGPIVHLVNVIIIRVQVAELELAAAMPADTQDEIADVQTCIVERKFRHLCSRRQLTLMERRHE